MNIKDYLIFSLGGVFVVFMFLSFYYDVGANYSISEDNSANISLDDYKNTLDSTKETSKTLEEIFESESIVITTYNLIVKGLPSAGKTIYRGTADSVGLTFKGGRRIFSTPAFQIAFTFVMAIILIILILMFWDWIRGIKISS
jgi:hypothetical protein